MEEQEDPEQADTLRLIRPEDAVPFEYAEFDFAFQLANAAGGLRMPMESPRAFGVTIEDEDLRRLGFTDTAFNRGALELKEAGLIIGDEGGSLDRFAFTDTAMNRAGIALKEHFGQDLLKLQSALHRFFGLLELVRNRKLGPWIRDSKTDPDAREIHPAVIAVCGRLRLTKAGRFPVKRLLREVERAAREEFPDEEFPG